MFLHLAVLPYHLRTERERLPLAATLRMGMAPVYFRLLWDAEVTRHTRHQSFVTTVSPHSPINAFFFDGGKRTLRAVNETIRGTTPCWPHILLLLGAEMESLAS